MTASQGLLVDLYVFSLLVGSRNVSLVPGFWIPSAITPKSLPGQSVFKQCRGLLPKISNLHTLTA